MGLSQTVAPALEPVTLVEMKTHLRIDGNDEDDHLNALITAARQQAEVYTHRAFVSQTFDFTMDRFPSGEFFRIPRPRAISITSITYTDEDGNPQTLSTDVYDLDVSNEPARVFLKYDQDWPDTRDIFNAVTVKFVAGYGAAASDVPETIKAAIKLIAAHLYENRENVIVGTISSELPFSAKTLLAGELVAEAR